MRGLMGGALIFIGIWIPACVLSKLVADMSWLRAARMSGVAVGVLAAALGLMGLGARIWTGHW